MICMLERAHRAHSDVKFAHKRSAARISQALSLQNLNCLRPRLHVRSTVPVFSTHQTNFWFSSLVMSTSDSKSASVAVHELCFRFGAGADISTAASLPRPRIIPTMTTNVFYFKFTPDASLHLCPYLSLRVDYQHAESTLNLSTRWTWP